MTQEVPRRGFVYPPPELVGTPTCPQEVAQLITECMHADPHERPTAKQVVERLLACPPFDVGR